jgi:hypothetical protein
MHSCGRDSGERNDSLGCILTACKNEGSGFVYMHVLFQQRQSSMLEHFLCYCIE